MSSSTTAPSTETTSTLREEKTIIDKILGEMKSEFNKSDLGAGPPKSVSEMDQTLQEVKPEPEELPDEEEMEKPRIILSFKKPIQEQQASNGKIAPGKRPPRQKSTLFDEQFDEVALANLKRSARRRSKDYPESILQSAIARKEKSYNEANKPQRLTRQLKPTQKILENLAMAKHKTTAEKRKGASRTDSDSFHETDGGKTEGEAQEKVYKKHKHKHTKKKVKRIKTVEKDTDSEGSPQEENIRRSRRISQSRCKEESNTDSDEVVPHLSTTLENAIISRLCLCTQKTKYFVAAQENETQYCGAVDSIDSKLIGCSRSLDNQEVMMLRSSTKTPYTIFCDVHRNRLLRHNCCPNCGVFCTQGQFLECESKHHYHKDCQIVINDTKCCPHCGQPSTNEEVCLRMRSLKKPVFLPVQKTQYVFARMTFPNNFKHENDPPLLPIGALDMQNSLEYGEEEYELSDFIYAVKSNLADKVAVILGSKSVPISTKIPEFGDGTALHYACQKGLLPIVHMLLVAGHQTDFFDKDQNTPLMLAILSSHNNVVQYLIRTGSSISLKGTDGMTALHLAAKCGNLKACELLLKAVSPSIRDFVNGQDDGGWTPLVWACEHGYVDIANFLIFKGADPNVRDVEHNVALHWASFSGSPHIAQLLLDKGCNVNAVNAHGDTPLHIGARLDMYDCIIVLLARGADVTLLNKNKESALDCVPPGGDSYNPISMNITLQATVDSTMTNVIVCNDLSRGKEANPIQCYNNIDIEPKPSNFCYITKNCFTLDDIRIEQKISSLQSCQCEDRCMDFGCLCGNMSVKCWYDEEGKLKPDLNFNDIPMIFECNDNCSCNTITCNNRVVQKGLTHRFEVFKTLDKGWGVRSLRVIQKGSFVCEYVGEIITDAEADKRDDDSFVFDLESRVCRNSDIDSYCIDAKFYGNFARFINHSCDPNLTSLRIFIDHQDLRFPRIAFFANRDIMGDEELSFDYGEKFWMAKYKSFSCSCGSIECKYSEEIIDVTVENHQRSMNDCE